MPPTETIENLLVEAQPTRQSSNLCQERVRVLLDEPEGLALHMDLLLQIKGMNVNPGCEERSRQNFDVWTEKFKNLKSFVAGRAKLKQIVELMSKGECLDLAEGVTPQGRNKQEQPLTPHDLPSAFTLLALIEQDIENAPSMRQHILDAEVTSFTADETKHLLKFLYRYILDQRESNDIEDQITVCSAIRSYIGNMQVDDLNHLADFLQPTGRARMSAQTLLETIKMVTRKLCANPATEVDLFPRLEEELIKISCAYATPYVLTTGLNAALALNAFLALAAINSRQVLEIGSRLLPDLPIWFRTMLVSRVREVIVSWKKHTHSIEEDKLPFSLATQFCDYVAQLDAAGLRNASKQT